MIKLTKYRLNEILSEIENESIEIILDEGRKTIKEYGFDTKRYFITIDIDVTEKGTYYEGDGIDYPPEFTVDKTDINIELVSIHLDEKEIEVGEYLDKIVMAVRGIIDIC